jgi:hypothetical protein
VIFIYFLKEDITSVYKELNTFFKGWGKILNTQNDVIKNKIKDFFKYTRSENLSYKDLIKTREEIKTKYTSELLRLNVKKEKLWTQMDLTKWELKDDGDKLVRGNLVKDKNYAFQHMCYKESNNLINMHKKLAYYNKMVMKELRRMIGNHCSRFKTNMKGFLDDFYPTLADV